MWPPLIIFILIICCTAQTKLTHLPIKQTVKVTSSKNSSHSTSHVNKPKSNHTKLQPIEIDLKDVNIGSALEKNDIVKSGVVIDPWSLSKQFIEPQEKYVRIFYVSHVGLSLCSASLNATSAVSHFKHSKMLGPRVVLNKQVNGTEISITYNCFGRKSVSILWMTLQFDVNDNLNPTKETGEENKKREDDGNENDKENEQADIIHKHVTKEITLVWSKYCSPSLTAKEGFNIGTREGMANVVENGVTNRDWSLTTNTLTVHAGTRSTTFYISMSDNQENQLFGPPHIQGNSATYLHPIISGSAMWGGVASSTPLSFTISYQCEEIESRNALTLIIPLCSDGSSPKDCTIRDEGDYIHEPIALRWTKNCFKDNVNNIRLFPSFVKIFLFLITTFCFGGCFYKYSVIGARGIEIIPYIDTLRTLPYQLTKRNQYYNKYDYTKKKNDYENEVLIKTG